MDLRIKLTNEGVGISIRDGATTERLIPSSKVDQEHPRGYYIYAHQDRDGRFFYIGKGRGRRAWSTDRHPLWHRYVNKHLGGRYDVRILVDGMQPDEAESLEAEWIAQESDGLLNWINMGRDFDLDKNRQFLDLRDANLALIANARAIEKTDPKGAIILYEEAIARIRDYAFLMPEGGLVGKLLREEREEVGVSGQLEALDRITLCLTKLGNAKRAAQIADEYFATYKMDLNLRGAEIIKKRVAKALEGTRERQETEVAVLGCLTRRSSRGFRPAHRQSR